MEQAEKKATVEAVSKEALVVKAYEKLNRKSLEVEVPVNLSLVQELTRFVEEARKTDASPETLAEAEQKVNDLRKDTIVATLVPLKAVEILMVQGFVTETALLVRQQGFDFDVQLFTMAKAERAATVYLALRKRGALAERYFKTQEEVTLVDEGTLKELSRLYGENFVLTPEERKNS